MTFEEIKQRILNAEKLHITKFKESLKQAGLPHVLQYCFPRFRINDKKKVYSYDVELLFDIEFNEYLYREGKNLISVNPETGEKGIVINNSYKGILIYQSESDLLTLEDPVIVTDLPATEIRNILKTEKLVIQDYFSPLYYIEEPVPPQKHPMPDKTLNPVQMFINGQETDSHMILYDEFYYRKYIEGKEIYPFELYIDLNDFNERMQPKYAELLNELIADDLLVNENYALELFENLTEYPSYKDILNDTLDMKKKINFLDPFLISQIFNEYFWKNNKDNWCWIIREVLYFNKKEDKIMIKGNVQRID
ncbi:hypothetical protein [Chryseobacterium indologenes]|uniref:Uncharacterized protein n=1 Tax=Chryseobacterium indologenes TaxID=253 RepID=A0A0N0IY06_CHRID|nr:hypothetical protein [Chryseobacterium indologenes]KPE52731.1 hypothetical protein AOB46_01610 [Chryseobacterium indologenes]